jgi:hypothetical protein
MPWGVYGGSMPIFLRVSQRSVNSPCDLLAPGIIARTSQGRYYRRPRNSPLILFTIFSAISCETFFSAIAWEMNEQIVAIKYPKKNTFMVLPLLDTAKLKLSFISDFVERVGKMTAAQRRNLSLAAT